MSSRNPFAQDNGAIQASFDEAMQHVSQAQGRAGGGRYVAAARSNPAPSAARSRLEEMKAAFERIDGVTAEIRQTTPEDEALLQEARNRQPQPVQPARSKQEETIDILNTLRKDQSWEKAFQNIAYLAEQGMLAERDGKLAFTEKFQNLPESNRDYILGTLKDLNMVSDLKAGNPDPNYYQRDLMLDGKLVDGDAASLMYQLRDYAKQPVN